MFQAAATCRLRPAHSSYPNRARDPLPLTEVPMYDTVPSTKLTMAGTTGAHKVVVHQLAPTITWRTL